MPTIHDVYRKFGEVAEAAQLLETSLGSILIMEMCLGEDLLDNQDPKRASDIFDRVNRHTLGHLLKSLNNCTQSLDALEVLLLKARDQRNRLSHAFYREHNFRRNSEEGRAIMVKDLDAMHTDLWEAYKAVLKLQYGEDLDELCKTGVILSTKHLPI